MPVTGDFRMKKMIKVLATADHPAGLMEVRVPNIVAKYDPPPIPSRNCDWQAIDDDTYEGGEDSFCPVGYGKTEQEAIDDLKEKLDLCLWCDAPPDANCACLPTSTSEGKPT